MASNPPPTVLIPLAPLAFAVLDKGDDEHVRGCAAAVQAGTVRNEGGAGQVLGVMGLCPYHFALVRRGDRLFLSVSLESKYYAPPEEPS